MRTTVADAKASRIPQAIGCCPDDPRFLSTLNEALQRLLIKGKYWGTYGKYRICATEGCITLPPQLATIETAAVCGVPIHVRDLWYEFLENGPGLEQCGNGSGSCGCGSSFFGMGCSGDTKYRGHYPTFADIRGENKKVNLVCDLSEDVGVEVLVLGYDENFNWIRTEQSGQIRDGELIALAQSAGTTSSSFFSSITDIQLPERSGQVWLYEFNADDSTKRMIGQYQYWETRPSYARYFFSGIRSGSGEDGCQTTPVEIIGKHEFIPVKQDTDYLCIGNLPALKNMCQAVQKYEEAENPAAVAQAVAFEQMAVRILDSELNHYLGDGKTPNINLSGSSIGTAVPVPNLL